MISILGGPLSSRAPGLWAGSHASQSLYIVLSSQETPDVGTSGLETDLKGDTAQWCPLARAPTTPKSRGTENSTMKEIETVKECFEWQYQATLLTASKACMLLCSHVKFSTMQNYKA